MSIDSNAVIRFFLGAPTGACSSITFGINSITGDLYDCLSGVWHLIGGGGTGTVTSVSGLSPLFTTSNPTTTPTFALSNVADKTFFGNHSGGSAAPSFIQPAYSDLSGTPAIPTGTGFSHVTSGVLDAAAKLVNLTASTDVAANQGTTTTVFHGNASGQGSFASIAPADFASVAANTVFGNNTVGSATPGFQSLVKAQQVAATVYNDQNNTYTASTAQAFDAFTAKYWGGAPEFDATKYAGTDMCDKIAAVQTDAAFIAVASARIKVDGFTGDQNCATSNPFASTHSTKWGPFNPGLHVHLTRSAFTFGPATSSLIAAPAAPTLATATTGGSLAAATTYGVKVTLVNLSGETTPSAEATKLTGAGATNSITVTSPTVAFPASTGAVAYNVYSATPVGSGWKLNNTSGPIPLGTPYVIKTVGAGAVPPVTNLAANDQYEVDFGGSTWSIESATALILAAVNNTYFHDLTLINSTTLDNGVANAYVNSNISNVVFERITSLGGRIGFAINNGDSNIRFSNLRWGNPTVGTGGQVGIYITSGGGVTPSNIVIDGFELLPSVFNTTTFISAGILTNPCNNCSIRRTRCTNVDMSLSANGGCIEIGGNNTPTGGSTNIHIYDTFCDNLIWMDCIAVNSFSSNINIDTFTFTHGNQVTGINGLTTFQQGDCLDIFMASNINVVNGTCQFLSTLSHTLPGVEIFDTQEVTLTNVKILDSAGGIKLFGAPSTHLVNVNASRNFNAGYQIIDYNALVTCNGTTAVVFVSGPGGFGPWVGGTAITINGVAHQIASVTDGTHLVTAANCAAGASVTMLMPTTDVSIVNPKADDNGANATGTGSRTGTSEGIFVSGGSQITILGGSANDNKATASKTQQYGLRVIGTARARVALFDASNNVGAVTAPCTGIEYGANVAGNHAICDDAKNSLVLNDDNATNVLTLSAQQTVGPNNKIGQGSLSAATGAINTTETVITKSGTAVNASRLIVGSVIRIAVSGTCTATVANTSTFRVRIGTAGTTADGVIATFVTGASAASGTTIPFRCEIILTVRAIGASATIAGDMTLLNSGTTGIATVGTQVILPTTASFNSTTAAQFVTVTYQSAATTTTSTLNQAAIEVVYQ